MKERPILFSGAMVRALLAGTKTQTRRIVKSQPPADKQRVAWYEPGVMGWAPPDVPSQHWHRVRCPYGQPGDRLWVREAFGHFERNDNFSPGCEVFYRADGECLALQPWRPSIHMPRWASRITLEVTSVRVERLQDISEADALAEGIVPHVRGGWHWHPHNPSDLDDWHQFGFKTAAYAYESLWEQINGPGSWDSNPWVWAVEFKRLETAA